MNKEKKALITGGTVFVSRYVAEYYVQRGYTVYVLNRNHGIQSEGVQLIQADRHALGNRLHPFHFDVVFDMTAYTATDVNDLLDALGGYDDYILLSSSAVYQETSPQPFTEETPTGPNKFWGNYGVDKINAENALIKRNPNAYILRPPYLYGPMNNLYREAFVFECALRERAFCLPEDGEMKLQFFHVHDLCLFMDALLDKRPDQHIFNVGNPETVTVRDWVSLCYGIVGKAASFIHVSPDIEQRNYFSFYPYEYRLDVRKQKRLLSETKPLEEGLRESFRWYLAHTEKVKRKPYIDYINKNLSFKTGSATTGCADSCSD